MRVYAIWPTLACPHVGVHNRISLLMYFISSAQYVLLVWFVRWEISGHTSTVLLSVASSICSKQHIAFSSSFPLPFFSYAFRYHQLGVTDWKKFHFILSQKLSFYMINNLSLTVHLFAISIQYSIEQNNYIVINESEMLFAL